MQALIEKLDKLHHEKQFREILDEIEKLPPEQRGYAVMGQYARALNNLERYEEALEVIEKIKNEGARDCLWHYRKGFALFYLDREEEAAACFEKAVELCGDDEEYRTIKGDAAILMGEALKCAAIRREGALYYDAWRGNGGSGCDGADKNAWTF